VAVKRHDAQGRVVGETRFLGLYTAAAYAAPASDIPRVRQNVAQVLSDAALMPESHAAKSLQAILEAYPRDELFQVDSATLREHAIGILRLQERQRTRLFLRRDPFGRFTSAQVFVQRDRYNTELRQRVGQELLAALGGDVDRVHADAHRQPAGAHPLHCARPRQCARAAAHRRAGEPYRPHGAPLGR
jgi:glutamate dehydrogenase